MIVGAEDGIALETRRLQRSGPSTGRLPVDLDVDPPVGLLATFRARCSVTVDIL